MNRCRICDNLEGNQTFSLNEKMFGTGEVFHYFKCAECGCLQIADIPDSLKRYYDNGYYSFKEIRNCFDNVFKSYFKRLRTRYTLADKTLFAMLFLKLYPPPDYFDWLKKATVTINSEILDIGCGSGELLVRLRKDGFKSLTGLDAFIEDDILYDNGVSVYKKTLSEQGPQYDFIMLNHSFEHMPDPMNTARNLYRALRRDRFVLIRVPVVSSYAWEKYGHNWVQLDVPRHLYLHTEKSIRTIAQKTGFEVKNVTYDSYEFQFWGSEQYLNGISLKAPESLENGLERSIFTKKQIKEFKLVAADLNKKGAGDQACFYLYKP